MRSRFLKREYPEILKDSEMRKVKCNIKVTNKNKKKNGVPIAVTKNPF